MKVRKYLRMYLHTTTRTYINKVLIKKYAKCYICTYSFNLYLRTTVTVHVLYVYVYYDIFGLIIFPKY